MATTYDTTTVTRLPDGVQAALRSRAGVLTIVVDDRLNESERDAAVASLIARSRE